MPSFLRIPLDDLPSTHPAEEVLLPWLRERTGFHAQHLPQVLAQHWPDQAGDALSAACDSFLAHAQQVGWVRPDPHGDGWCSTVGEILEPMRLRYAHGLCFLLAQTLHRVFGLERLLLLDEDGDPLHALNRTDEGLMIDAYGLCTMEDLERRYGITATLAGVDDEGLAKAYEVCDDEQCLAVVADVVRPLLGSLTPTERRLLGGAAACVPWPSTWTEPGEEWELDDEDDAEAALVAAHTPSPRRPRW